MNYQGFPEPLRIAFGHLGLGQPLVQQAYNPLQHHVSQHQQQEPLVPRLPGSQALEEGPSAPAPAPNITPPFVPGALGLVWNTYQLGDSHNVDHGVRSTSIALQPAPDALGSAPEHAASLVLPAAPSAAPEGDGTATDRRARAQQLLLMFPNVELDCAVDMLEQCGDDLDACAAQMLSVFGQHTGEHMHSHLHAASLSVGWPVDADAKLAAELHQQETGEFEQQLRSKRVPQVVVIGSKQSAEQQSPAPALPPAVADDCAHLLLSPSDYFAACNPGGSTCVAPVAQHVPATAQSSLANALDDAALVEGFEAEEQLFGKQAEQERISKLCKDRALKLKAFFPDSTLDELESVLAAFEGDMTAAMDFMLTTSEEEARLQQQRLEQDQECARHLDEVEAQLQQSGNGTVPSRGDEDLQQVLSGSVHPAGQAIHKVSSGSSLFKASARLDALERDGCASAPGAPVPKDEGHRCEAVNPQLERGVATLQRAFGGEVDHSLLLDVLRNCHGHINSAIVQLQQMGLEQVGKLDTSVHAGAASFSPASTSNAMRATYTSTQQTQASRWLMQRMVPPTTGAGVRLTAERLAALNQAKQQGRKSEDDGTLSTISEDSISSSGQEDMDAFVHEFERMRKHGHGMGSQEVHENTEAMYQWLRAKSERLKARCKKLAFVSRQAYANNDRKTAGELAERRRMLLARAEAATEMAADKLYVWRNAGRRNALVWDFHGLHVEEAVRKLSASINAANMLPGRKHVEIITGRGSHSRGGEPKLKLAVRDFLHQNSIPFEEMEGAMLITLEPTLEL